MQGFYCVRVHESQGGTGIPERSEDMPGKSLTSQGVITESGRGWAMIMNQQYLSVIIFL